MGALHVAWVDAPGGRVDFVRFGTLNGSLRESCLVWMKSGDTGPITTTTCGAEVVRDETVIHILGSNGVRSSILLRTSREVTLVGVTTAPGEEYLIRPASGLAYAEWPVERGETERVVAFDFEGNEVWSEDV